MNSDELRCCLKLICRSTQIKNTYVLASNEVNIIDKTKLPCAVIVNSDPSNKPFTFSKETERFLHCSLTVTLNRSISTISSVLSQLYPRAFVFYNLHTAHCVEYTALLLFHLFPGISR
jgi:hypothetical protein